VLVAGGATMVGIWAANFTLEGIETGDPMQHLDGNRRLVGEVEELAPNV
jgi:2-methylcitrate dehydratase PrpD